MRVIALAVVLIVGCGKSEKDALKDEMESAARAKKFAEPTKTSSDTVKQPSEAPPPTEKKPQEEIKEPDPNKPEEVDEARKKAMILGRDKEVIRFCEMGKYAEKVEKGDPQIMFGCTLAACRLMDGDKAREWAKQVQRSKPLYEQAIKTCMANKVAL